MPFCYKAWEHDDWCNIPWEDRNEKNAIEKYSLTLSLLSILIVFPNWFLISLKDINMDERLDLSFIR